MRILLHICCACCLARAMSGLRAEWGDALAVEGFFYNPNIHPLLEFRKRLKAVKVYLERDPIPVRFEESYGLVPFCEDLRGAYDPPERCALCYARRLGETARVAAEAGVDAFSTTLLVSRQQDLERIRASGEEAAAVHGTPFLFRDLREAEAPEGKVRGLYRQQYCGCVFSEAERFASTRRDLYKGPAGESTPAVDEESP